QIIGESLILEFARKPVNGRAGKFWNCFSGVRTAPNAAIRPGWPGGKRYNKCGAYFTHSGDGYELADFRSRICTFARLSSRRRRVFGSGAAYKRYSREDARTRF